MILPGIRTLVPILTLVLVPTGCLANYTLISGDYQVVISPTVKETVRSIRYQDHELAGETGYYGAVIASAPGKFIGAGHTEGGEEQVLARSLTRDGQNIEPVTGQRYVGEQLVHEKISRYDQAVFLTRIQLTPEGIIEQKRFLTTGEQPLALFYVNMFCWTKQVTAYYALAADGDQPHGHFDGTRPWHLKRDIRWTAVHAPGVNKGLLVYYPEIIQGARQKAAYWERPMYNKFYMMAAMPPVLPAGYHSRTYTVVLRGFETPEELPATAEAAAALSLPLLGEIPPLHLAAPE